jgi:hypothetical protein
MQLRRLLLIKRSPSAPEAQEHLAQKDEVAASLRVVYLVKSKIARYKRIEFLKATTKNNG